MKDTPNILPDDKAALDQALIKELQRKRVLIADRHPPARDALRMMLSTMGVVHVHSAGKSVEVVRQVKSHRFDVILADYYLDDGRDGQQLLEELRYARLIHPGTVYLITTSERSYHSVASIAELTPDAYLIRPFTAEELQNRLLRAVQKKHQLRQIYAAMEKQSVFEAINACDRALKRNPRYTLDILKLKAGLLLSLGSANEAEHIYRQVLSHRPIAWAKMGVAVAQRGQGALAAAAELAREVIAENKEFLAAYDFLADVLQIMGQPGEAQEVLESAAAIAPHNSIRQRLVGDIAVHNDDLQKAVEAYGKVVARHQSSSITTVDDYANLGRALLATNQQDAAFTLRDDMRKQWRGQPQGEFAGMMLEMACLHKANKTEEVKKMLPAAMELFAAAKADASGERTLSPRVTMDLADLSFTLDGIGKAEPLLRQLASENHDNETLLKQIGNLFEKHGAKETGDKLLQEVNAEMVALNNRGVMAAKEGDLEGSVKLLMEAADQAPNVQFLCNAAKAAFTLIDKRGWDAPLAEQALRYLHKAQLKAPTDHRVNATREYYTLISRKYGIGA